MNYIPCLTGLRGFAILIVIFSHFHAVAGLPEVIYKIISFSDFGSIGVRLFFTLSGFLITSILFKEYNKTGHINIKLFFVKRLFRIFPSYYFYLIFLYILKHFGIVTINNEVLVASLFYIQNINYLQNDRVIPYSWLVIHSWSLSVEEQFYIGYPFVFKFILYRILKNSYSILFTVLAIAAFFRVFNYSFPNYSLKLFGFFLMHLDFLFVGCFLAFKFEDIKYLYMKNFNKYSNLMLFVLGLLSVMASKYEFSSGFYMIFCGTIVLFSVFYIILYILLFPNSYFGRFLENSIIKYLGILSYSLYVWQQLFLSSSNEWIKYKFITLFPYNIIMVFICALFSYYVIEQPFMKMRQKFIQL